MNILFLNWQDIKHPLGGGAEVYHHETLKRLAAMGHSVTWLCSIYKGLTDEENIDGIKIIRRGGRNLFNYAAPSACKKLIQENTYDIVIDSINKIPLATPKYVKNIPILAYVHHLFSKTIFNEVLLPFALYFYLFERRISKTYRNIPVCCVSESTKQELTGMGFDEKLISIIENCVDHDLYKAPPEGTHEKFLVGYLGRIKKYKSVDHLIKAFPIIQKEIPESRLKIIGDGDNLPELKKLAAGLGINDSVEFTGFLAKQDKVEALQKCSVVVNPSIKEGWGLTVVEANACGVPVIAADVPGLRDSVVNGKTGVLYPYGDIERCAELTIKMLRDDNLRNSYRKNALEWAAGFNWDSAADKTLELIEKTIREF